jgi:hypothetical protein
VLEHAPEHALEMRAAMLAPLVAGGVFTESLDGLGDVGTAWHGRVLRLAA